MPHLVSSKGPAASCGSLLRPDGVEPDSSEVYPESSADPPQGVPEAPAVARLAVPKRPDEVEDGSFYVVAPMSDLVGHLFYPSAKLRSIDLLVIEVMRLAVRKGDSIPS